MLLVSCRQLLLKQLLKWEHKLAAADSSSDPALAAACEGEFLDFLQHYYWSLLSELEWEAMRFAQLQVSQPASQSASQHNHFRNHVNILNHNHIQNHRSQLPQPPPQSQPLV